MYPIEYKKENMERVIDEALVLGKEIGIEKLNKTILAKQTGLSLKTMDRYFHSKSELLYRIAEKMLNTWYGDIGREYGKSKPENATAAEALLIFMKVHNSYILTDYKGLLLLQQLDLHFRYLDEEQNLFWNRFRKTDKLEQRITTVLERGIKDGSIDEKNVAILASPQILTALCAGIVEHLVCYIHSNEMTTEEAIAMSNQWIDGVVNTITSKP